MMHARRSTRLRPRSSIRPRPHSSTVPRPDLATLIVVGTGIKAVGHLTADAQHWIARADKLLHVVADPVIDHALRQLNPSAESMRSLYASDRRRRATYDE